LPRNAGFGICCSVAKLDGMTQATHNDHATFRPPCWRWLLAGEILEGLHADMDDSDGELQALVAFRAAMAAGQESDNQALAVAHKVFVEDGPQRWELEARLLAGQTDAMIAERCGLTAETVAVYEATFFNVRGCLGAWGYIRQHVIGAGIDCGFRNDELRTFWAWLTFSSQPLLIERLIDTFHRNRRPGEPPTLSIYLRADAGIAPRLQAFVASAVVPHFGPAGKAWTEITLLQIEADATADPDHRALLRERARDYLIRCGQACLAAKPLPKLRRAGQTAKRAPSNGKQQGMGIRRVLTDDPVLRAMADDLGLARVLMDGIES